MHQTPCVESVAGNAQELTNMSDEVAQTAERLTQLSDTLAQSIAATRELIVRENRKYSRRQLIWFRKEPNLQWIHAAGERAETLEEVARVLTLLEIRPDASVS